MPEKCIHCGGCKAVCPSGLRKSDGRWQSDGSSCRGCGPNPIEFENGYVAFEDLPDDKKKDPDDEDFDDDDDDDVEEDDDETEEIYGDDDDE